MKKIIYILLLTTIMLNAWAIQTHRAINRTAYKKADNLIKFMDDANLDKEESYFHDDNLYTILDDWKDEDATYFTYITTHDPAMKDDNQTFTKFDYKDIIEAGAILEDATWHYSRNIGGGISKGNGRFLNHFYEAQDLFTFGTLGASALTWSNSSFNKYSNPWANKYFYDAFTKGDFEDRKRARAQMFVSVGHLMHLFNDISQPAHVRGDNHPMNNPMDSWGGGGPDMNTTYGYFIKESTLHKGSITGIEVEANKFNDFETPFIADANYASRNYFSEDTIWKTKLFGDYEPTKEQAPEPVLSDYEDISENVKHNIFDKCVNGDEDYSYPLCDLFGNTEKWGDISLAKKAYIRRGGSGDKLGIAIESHIQGIVSIPHVGNPTHTYENKDIFTTMVYDIDTSVLQTAAEVLIPRAVDSGAGFVNYFFRGSMEAGAILEDAIWHVNFDDEGYLMHDMRRVV